MTARISILLVQKAVARKYGITVDQMIGQQKGSKIVEARHIAMFLACALSQSSYAVIGRAFGNRDRTTVSYAWERVERMVVHSKDFALGLERLTLELRRDQDEQDRFNEACAKALGAIYETMNGLYAGLTEAARRDPFAVLEQLAALKGKLP